MQERHFDFSAVTVLLYSGQSVSTTLSLIGTRSVPSGLVRGVFFPFTIPDLFRTEAKLVIF